MQRDRLAPVAIELKPLDITPYRRGNTGVAYVTTFDSGRPGPHVMVNALTHGNELCGAHALHFLFANEVRPMRGALTLSFANVAAYEAFDPDYPFFSRFIDEDFNRVWDEDVLEGPNESAELARARALRPIVDSADCLLDIHSTDLAQPPMLICGGQAKGRELARALGYPAHVVTDAGHAAGRRLRDYGPFDDPKSPKTAMLVECGQHFAAEAARVAIQTTLRFLRHFDLVDPAFLAPHLEEERLAPQVMVDVTEAVTAAGDAFTFVEDYRGFETILKAGTLIARDGEREVRTPYDDCVLVMPARSPAKGLTAVRLGRVVG